VNPTPSAPRIVVLAGGLSHERDVSLRSGRRVAEALRSTGAEVTVHDVDADLVPVLTELAPDLVWPLLHGASGEDGSVRDVLALLGLRVLGTGPAPAASPGASRSPRPWRDGPASPLPSS